FIMKGTEKVSMGRAPYYGTLYFIFRVLLPQEISYDLVVIVQLIVECLAIIYLSALCFIILKHRLAFLLTYVLMLVSLNSTFWSNALLTESLSISFLIFFAWHYYHYLTTKSRRSLLLCGVFLSLTVLLKPYFALLYVPMGILFLLEKPFSPGK